MPTGAVASNLARGWCKRIPKNSRKSDVHVQMLHLVAKAARAAPGGRRVLWGKNPPRTMFIKLHLSSHPVFLPASGLLLFMSFFNFFFSAGGGNQPGFQGQPLGLCEWGKSPRMVMGVVYAELPPLGKAQSDPGRLHSDLGCWSGFQGFSERASRWESWTGHAKMLTWSRWEPGK